MQQVSKPQTTDMKTAAAETYCCKHVVFSLSGKASHCECEEQGSPESFRGRRQPMRLGVTGNTFSLLSF